VLRRTKPKPTKGRLGRPAGGIGEVALRAVARGFAASERGVEATKPKPTKGRLGRPAGGIGEVALRAVARGFAASERGVEAWRPVRGC
jgi:hypothetical protein